MWQCLTASETSEGSPRFNLLLLNYVVRKKCSVDILDCWRSFFVLVTLKVLWSVFSARRLSETY